MEQYIKKSTLVAEIEKKIMQYEVAFNNPSFASYEASLIAKGKYRKLLDIRQFLDTLEVVEVDLIIHTVIAECCNWLAINTNLSHNEIEDCRNLMLTVKEEQLKA